MHFKLILLWIVFFFLLPHIFFSLVNCTQEVIAVLICITVFILFLFWITVHPIYIIVQRNHQSNLCDGYCFHFCLSTFFHQTSSLRRIIAFKKAQARTFTRKTFSQDQNRHLSPSATEGSKSGRKKMGGNREVGRWKSVSEWYQKFMQNFSDHHN